MTPIKATLVCLIAASLACSGDAAGPPPVNPGRMTVQIGGAVHLTSEWQAFGEFRDLLASDTGQLSLMNGQNRPPSTGDSSFTLQFPGRLDVGQFAVGRYVPGAVPTVPVVSVLLGGREVGLGDARFFGSLPGGTLTIDSAGYPPRPGLDLGGLRGTLTFNAVSLLGTPDTITVHATFNSHWYHYIFPNLVVTLSGAGPVVGTSQFSTAQSLDDDHGGRFVEWAPDFGTFTLPAITTTQFNDPAQWPALYTALFYRDDPRIALSTGGTLTITQFIAPTDEFYGEIHGTLTSRLALWTDPTTLSGDSVDASITFAVQLWPLGGIPASAPAFVR